MDATNLQAVGNSVEYVSSDIITKDKTLWELNCYLSKFNLMKALENINDTYIRGNILSVNLSKAQHAYKKDTYNEMHFTP